MKSSSQRQQHSNVSSLGNSPKAVQATTTSADPFSLHNIDAVIEKLKATVNTAAAASSAAIPLRGEE